MSVIYYDVWNFGSDLEIRPPHRAHDIVPIKYYPRQRFIPEVTRNGFRRTYHDIPPYDFFCFILSDNKAETLLKAGQYSLFRYFARNQSRKITDYWASIRICIRNNYTVTDGAMWCDYVDLLRYFVKDVHSPKYICPENINSEHDRYVRKKHAEYERQRLEQQRRKAKENEERFRELKAKFFGISFTDGNIHVRVLDSVDDFVTEGMALHHCVFASEYYLRPDSLILSAYIEDQRIEVSLKTMKVIQSRGACNKNTEYHDTIIKLVSKNMKHIRKRMAA